MKEQSTNMDLSGKWLLTVVWERTVPVL